MKRVDKQAPLVIAALHEAGHVVACYLLHEKFGNVTIEPGEKPKEKNYPKKTSKSIPSEKQLATIRREHVVSLAGPMAVGISGGRCEFEDMLSFISQPPSPTANNDELDLAFWKMIFVETKLLLYAPRNWQAVISLSTELLKEETIRHQTARDIIKQAIEDYEEGIRDDISALHRSRYSDFVKKVTDAKAKFRERAKDICLGIAARDPEASGSTPSRPLVKSKGLFSRGLSRLRASL
jgi:hypothetical protein